jgi:hypothetical protein
MVYGRQLASQEDPLATHVHVDIRFNWCRSRILTHDDVIVLDGCEENLNDGKTYRFLSTVARLYVDEPYDYVMNADDDIFLWLPQLVASLGGMPRDDMYYGSMDPLREYMDGRWIDLSPLDWLPDCLAGGLHLAVTRVVGLSSEREREEQGRSNKDISRICCA